MPRKSIKFQSEAEEAAWHTTPEGQKQTQREFERAIKNGALVVSKRQARIPATDSKLLADLMARAKEKATQAISLRISVADIERAKALAAKRGVGYQTILKQAIHNGLKRKIA